MTGDGSDNEGQAADVTPSPAGLNGGRDQAGRFGRGNKCGQGNPSNKRVQRLRAALLRSVTPAILTEILVKLIEEARGGDVTAAREILDRTLGKPSPTELLERLEALEGRLERSADR